MKENYKKFNFEIESLQNRYLIKEIANLKITFQKEKIIDEPYRMLLFNDILVFYDLKNENKKKKNLIFYLLYLNVKEKGMTTELSIEVLYQNNWEAMTIIFGIKLDLNDFYKVITNHMEEYLKSLEKEKNLNVEEFKSKTITRMSFHSKIKNSQEIFDKLDSNLIKTYKDKIKYSANCQTYKSKIEDLEKQLSEYKKLLDSEKQSLNKKEAEFKKESVFLLNQKNSIQEMVGNTIAYDEQFRNLFPEGDAFKLHFGENIPSDTHLKGLIPHLTSTIDPSIFLSDLNSENTIDSKKNSDEKDLKENNVLPKKFSEKKLPQIPKKVDESDLKKN
jgi:hypothetical protein